MRFILALTLLLSQTHAATVVSGIASPSSGGDTLPTQTGNSGKFLTTNGSATSWGSAATTTLNNVGSTSIPADLVPSSAASKNIGSQATYWQVIYGANHNAIGGDIQVMDTSGNGACRLTRNATLPSGTATSAGLVSTNTPSSLGIWTPSTTGSLPIRVETGNASAGNSGAIIFQTGTASGTRGAITMSALYLLLPTGTGDPTAPEGSVYMNTSTHKMRLFDGSIWVDLN